MLTDHKKIITILENENALIKKVVDKDTIIAKVDAANT